jgi:hypothetical protein
MNKKQINNEWFAHQENEKFTHISRISVDMCYANHEIVPIRLIEDSNGTYFAWEKYVDHQNRPLQTPYISLVFDSIEILDMCFPQFTDGAIKQGLGRVLRVNIELNK